MKKLIPIIIMMFFTCASWALSCKIDDDISFQEFEECDFESVVLQKLVDFSQLADDPNTPVDVLIASYEDLSKEYLTLLSAACKYYDEPVCKNVPIAVEMNDLAMVNL